MLIKDFSGGLNERVHPTLLDSKYATRYINCDNESGILKGIKSPTTTDITVSGDYMEYFQEAKQLVSSDKETYYVEYRNKMYAFSPVDGNFKYDKYMNKSSIGIESPDSVISVSSSSGDTLVGTYQYRYTYYNIDTGTESAPSKSSSEIEVGGMDDNGVVTSKGSIDLSNIVPSTDPQTTTIRLYRLGGSLNAYTLVEELPPTTTSYHDDKEDLEIAGSHILDTIANSTPLVGMKYVIKSHAILFGAYNDKLYFSTMDNPEGWSRLNFIDFEDDITGIGSTQHGLLVFTRYKTYIITGTSASTFARHLLDGELGCINHRTIQYSNNLLVWLSHNGIAASNGGNLQLVSQAYLGLLDIQNSTSASVYDRVYFLSTKSYILIFDMRYNKIVRRLRYSEMPTIMFNGSLYGRRKNQLVKLFSSKEYEFMVYHSPILTEGSFSTLKHYKDFYISYKGELKIKVVLHRETGDVLVYNKKLDPNRVQADLKSLGTTSGYAIQFRISGRGEVHEIGYKVVGRENAR